MTAVARGDAAGATGPAGPASAAGAAAHPRHRIDDLLSAPIRLSIVAALSRVDDMDFAALRDAIELTDSALSKQTTTLADAGYLLVRKGYVGKRPRTWLSLDPAGRAALDAHLAALRAIVDGVD